MMAVFKNESSECESNQKIPTAISYTGVKSKREERHVVSDLSRYLGCKFYCKTHDPKVKNSSNVKVSAYPG